MKKAIVISLGKQILAIGGVAYAIIIAATYAIPHLPISNKENFQALLQVQLTLDNYHEAELHGKKILLFMGSSVVERGIAENYTDSLLRSQGINNIQTINSGVGGFFANANLLLLRTLLENGVKPERIVYGVFIEDLNGGSIIHNNFSSNTPTLPVQEKNVLNVFRFGPQALSPMIDVALLHIYLFAVNNAYREIPSLSAFQRLTFGENMIERDSNYTMDSTLLHQIESIYLLCRDYHIPFAIFNTPLRPTIESPADLPYTHRQDAYNPILQLAHTHGFPIWNLDQQGFFVDKDFLDTYHLTPFGARKMSAIVLQKILEWKQGNITQDSVNDFSISR